MDKANIKVYNYSGSFIGVATKTREIGFAGKVDDVPGMETLTFEEIEYINAHSDVFRRGRLEFDDSEKKEIFAALRINEDKVLYERDIDALITEWSKENVARIVAVESLDTMESIRGHMFLHRNRGDVDISTRMVTLIENRYKELTNGRTKSHIVVTDKPEENSEKMLTMSEVQRMLETERSVMMEQFKTMIQSMKNAPAAVVEPVKSEQKEVVAEAKEAVPTSTQSDAPKPPKTTRRTTRSANKNS